VLLRQLSIIQTRKNIMNTPSHDPENKPDLRICYRLQGRKDEYTTVLHDMGAPPENGLEFIGMELAIAEQDEIYDFKRINVISIESFKDDSPDAYKARVRARWKNARMNLMFH
tara:strand:- start:4272 stop:4610 length:339 start_codon:yes stop_codon:yes gene_type:complete